MTLYEELSRLLEGELSPDAEAALRRRIETEPEVARAWAALQGLDAELEPLLRPPPELNARLVRAHSRMPRWWLGVAPVLLAAAALLWLWPPPPNELLLARGIQRVDGEVRVLAGDVVVEVDGIAEISVEPKRALARGVGPGGDPMERRKAMLAAAAGAAVTVMVYEGTARVFAANEPTREVRAGEEVQVGSPPAPTSHPPPTDDEDLRARVAELELKNQLLEGLLSAQHDEAFGTPVPWPEDLPPELTPAGFEERMRDAIEECAPDVDLLGFDCSEPPCLAMLRPSADDWWDRLVNSCVPWTDSYTNMVSSASTEVTCADGSTERMHLLGWSTHLIEDTHPSTDAEKENASKRFLARIEEAKAAWRCASEE